MDNDDHKTFADQVGQKKFNRIVADFFANHYHDRGMKKWQGYFLSDHTAALKKQAAQESTVYEPLPEMPQVDIRIILKKAYANHNTVEIQIGDVNQDVRLFPPMRGKVAGTDDRDTVVLDDGTQIGIEHIRNIKLIKLPGEDGGPVH